MVLISFVGILDNKSIQKLLLVLLSWLKSSIWYFWSFFWSCLLFKLSLVFSLCVSVAALRRIPLCALINQHMSGLAKKFRDVKFIKAISTTCIPNYPDKNLPTIFVYQEGDIKAQFIGPLVFGGMNLTRDGECLHVCSSKGKAKLFLLGMREMRFRRKRKVLNIRFFFPSLWLNHVAIL